MSRWIYLGFAVAMLPFGPLRAQSVAEVLADHFDAVHARDFESALELTSPALRRALRNPAHFQEVIRDGYPMVFDPRSIEFLDEFQRGGATIQRVMIEDQRGDRFLLEYVMSEDCGVPVIDGMRVVHAVGAGGNS